MNNFKFHNPTALYFGKDCIADLAKVLPQDQPILVTFGSGSVKKNGVYDALIEQLKEFNLVEFWGIESNPKVETLRKAIELAKEKKCRAVLAVGGGSVIDGSKLIAAAVDSDEDPWQMVLKGYSKGPFLPLYTVLTLPATGSEMNAGAVISSEETQEKYAFYSQHPKASFLDPSYTFSLPPYQVACGLVDTFVHVMEQYLTEANQSRLMDRWAEGILLSIIEIAPLIQAYQENYDLMADFMLSATMGLNGFIAMGVKQDWATHMIGHELTALTGLTHGHTLAVVLPALLKVLGKGQKRQKMLHYAERIWGIDYGSESDRVDEAILCTEEFFRSLGLLTRLPELDIDASVSASIVQRFDERAVAYGEAANVDAKLAGRILELCSEPYEE